MRNDEHTRASDHCATDSETTLALAEGWVIDDLARQRLSRQLAGAPDGVTGVAAATGELPPGSSFRVHAERMALQPMSALAHTSSPVSGAVLLRGGITYELRDRAVDVTTGVLLLDPGAHAHDPWRPVGPLQTASDLGRPPFPWRPLVVLLTCDPDPDIAEWARTCVNALIRRDIEARLALPDEIAGLHLTRPCLANEASLHALAPDVVIALDPVALECAQDWCHNDRSTVLIELTIDVAPRSELVSWRLGEEQGRLRARIGRQDVPTLPALIRRLCAGPQPMPPVEGAR
jgi:hypothetical protein